MKGLYTIYNQRLAGYLMLNGFPLIGTVQDRKRGRCNFLFNENELLHDYIDRWQIDRLKTKTEQHDNK